MITTRLLKAHSSPLHLQPESISHQPFLPASGFLPNDEDEETRLDIEFESIRNGSNTKSDSTKSHENDRASIINETLFNHANKHIRMKSFNKFQRLDSKCLNVDSSIKETLDYHGMVEHINTLSILKHQVYVCVVFLKIGEIDTIKEQYAADVLIKSKWREPMLDNQTETLKYDWANSWSPKLYIENTIGEAKEHVYHMITFNEFNHAFLCEKRRVSGVFLENLELNHFPFDVQDLTITVASNLPTSEIRLVNDPDETHRINKQSFVDEQEWYLYKHIETEQRELAYEYTDLATVRPALSVKCRAARRPAYFIWNIFLVTFLICSLSLVTFAVDKKLPQNRLQLTYTLVLTLVAFKFVVNQCLPKISYLTYLDKYVISSLFILTLICLWHGLIVVIEKVSDRFKYVIPDDMEVYVIIIMAIGYMGYNIAFIVMIYCVACKRRRDMMQRDKEYVEKVQCQMKYKGMRAMRMIQQTHQLHEVKENGNATFI